MQRPTKRSYKAVTCVGYRGKAVSCNKIMCSLAINFEINLKGTLETTGLLAVCVVVAIIAVTRGYRRLFTPLNGKRYNMDSSCDKKPIPVENEENDWKVILPFRDSTLVVKNSKLIFSL